MRAIPLWFKNVFIITSIIILYKAVSFFFDFLSFEHYKSYLPQALEVEENLFVGSQIGGFIEGCGVAIFKITDDSSKKIKSGSIEFLNANRKAREQDREYANWIETNTNPLRSLLFSKVANSEGFSGSNCVNVDDELKNKILNAAVNSGSYYSVLTEHN